jgi:hypothetical protein
MVPALSTQAAECSPGGGIPEVMGAQLSPDHNAPTSAVGLGEVAAGTVEDTLKGCLPRVPKDASVGLRMMAEQDCKQEGGTRTLIQAAPNF